MTDTVYRVRQLVRKVEYLLLSHYSNIEVEGEISSWTVSARGHCYFALKEEPDILPCVLFGSSYRRTKGSFQTGDMVRVKGNLTVYAPRGNYQLIAQKIEKTGEGDFYKEFLRIKALLEEEGLFSPDHKKPIPQYPGRIGVITSLQGAAVRDILNITRRRNPFAHVIIRPTAVQGEQAVKDLVQALNDFEEYKKVDVIIMGRGGGSMEDLWAFNEEKVARALFKCSIPVISAVGHQSDIVITDLVGDFRAETPSAAAEKVTENYVTLLRNLQHYSSRLDQIMRMRYQEVFSRFMRLKSHPYMQQPQLFINKKQQVLDDYQQIMNKGLKNIGREYQQKLIYYKKHLKLLSPALMVARQKKQVEDIRKRMSISLQQSFFSACRDLGYFQQRLAALHPSPLLTQRRERLSHYQARLDGNMKRQMESKHQQLHHWQRLLETTNPFNLLKKGYTIIYDKQGKPVKRKTETRENQPVDIRFFDGRRSARIEDE